MNEVSANKARWTEFLVGTRWRIMFSGKKINIMCFVLFSCIVSGQSNEIHRAALRGDLTEVKELLRNNESLLRARDRVGATPLCYAARGGHKEIIEYLLTRGADINATDYLLATPLHYMFETSVDQEHLEAIELLIARGARVDARQWWGERVLMYAISQRNIEVVELLLSYGADVNGGTVDNSTPLYIAARGGNEDVVNLLLHHGASPDVYTYAGLSPLSAAAAGGHKDIVKLLLSKTSKSFYTDGFDRTPLHFAALSGNRELCEFLVEKGFDVNIRDDDNRTPLHWTAWHGQKNIAGLLIEKGALIDAKDRCGQTALGLAAICGNSDLVSLLIDKGADINSKNVKRQTALDLARIYARPEVEGILSAGNGMSQPKARLSIKTWLNRELKDKEAIFWHLGWSGWAVKTRKHLLIFDYWARDPAEAPSLGNGHINPDEILDLDVIVFVSHEHGDHFDSVILEWKETLKNARYIFGWKAFDDSLQNYLDEARREIKIGSIEVTTLHSWSDVRETAFLVRVDGLVIFNSGDYVGFYTGKEGTYKAEFDFLSKRYEQIDIAFFNGFSDSNEYMLESLSPKVAFPQHSPVYYNYKGTTRVLQEKFPNVKFYYAENRGDRFEYQNGEVR